jgi:DNA helicase-2/ATP-dependent DNA helicase PcrA
MTTVTPAVMLTPARLATELGLPPPTPEQAAVITAPAEPALVVAGAGAGKTETMAARVVWLVATGAVLPDQVLGLTFTRKAAQQLADRIRSRLRRLAGSRLLDELDPTGQRRAAVIAGDVTVATYHAYAGRLVSEHALRLPAEPGARLLSETAAWQLAHRVVSTWAADLDTDKVPATMTGYLLALAGELGEHLVGPGQLAEHAQALIALIENAPPGPRQRGGMNQTLAGYRDAQRMRIDLLPLLAAFTDRKRAERVNDFADQMSIAARIAEQHPEVGAGERERYRAVLLDEYQDTGHAQRVLLRALFRTRADEPPLALTAVGDPCQSIYGWRGASAANLPRFETDFPVLRGSGRWEPARQYGLLTSFRNPAEVLALANAVSEPLRTQGVRVDELRPREDAPPGTVRVALHTDVTAELDWVADNLADRWRARVDAGADPPTAAVLTRRRADMAPMAAALRARGLPVEVVGLGGLLAEPEVRDLVSALRLVADPLAGTAAVRLLTGARWRLGVADLAALWRRAKELARPLRAGPGTTEGAAAGAPPAGALLTDAMPGEHAEQAGLVDALDDPGPRENYSAAGHQRIVRLARELDHLRGRAGGAGTSGWAGLSDLVADTERALLLDTETAARPGPVGRVHLDAFADVVAEFAAGAEVPTLSALLDYLATAEDAEDGLSPGEVEVATDRVQILTVHAAKGLEWELVAVPNLVKDVFPGRRRTGTWLTNPAELPVALRGDAPDLPQPDLPPDANRKELEDGFKAHTADLEQRRLEEERRLLYVAITRAERCLLLSGHWWGTTDTKRGPSPFLTEVAEVAASAPESPAGGAVLVERWAEEPVDGDVNPVRATPRTGHWPADPLGHRRAEVARGAELVREELRRLRRADPAAPDPTQLSLFESGARGADGPDGPAEDDPDNWVADVDALLAERAAAREARHEVALPAALSVSQLVELAADPDALAARLRRPMPFPPNPHARRGTAFHAWLEQRFGATRLLDLDELPGAADDGAAGDDELMALRTAFLASAWAERRPIEVEVPFETVVFDDTGPASEDSGPAGGEDTGPASGEGTGPASGKDTASGMDGGGYERDGADVRAGIAVRGRMDAVFADPDGGVTVVDWKTGALPDDSKLPALSVQLAAYRLAWAALSGTDLSKVRAAFHYVRPDVTLRPTDLLDAEGLRTLLRSVPAAAGGRA